MDTCSPVLFDLDGSVRRLVTLTADEFAAAGYGYGTSEGVRGATHALIDAGEIPAADAARWIQQGRPILAEESD